MGLGFTYLFDTYLREITAEFGWTRASFSAAHASRLVALALASPLAGWATERSFGSLHVARIYGVLMLALMCGGLTGSVLAGRVFDQVGSYRPALVLFALLNVASLGLLAFVRRETGVVQESRLARRASAGPTAPQ